MTIANGMQTGTARRSLSTEARLLFMTAAATPDRVAVQQALSDGVDWEKLCSLAFDERATPILLRQLNGAGTATEVGYQRLRELATLSVMEMLQLEEMLRQTLDFLAQNGIEAMLLKGAGLAYTAYQSFADRPMGDIDLLIQPEDAARAWSLLRTRGWTPAPVLGTPKGYEGHHHLPPLFHETASCRLEIHDKILSGEHPFRFSTHTFWQSAKRLTVNGRAMTVPDRVHQMWHTCVHFAWSHSMKWGAWRALRDIEAISTGEPFNWSGFVHFARETRAATCCYWTLRIARQVVGAVVPDDVLASLRPPYPEIVAVILERHFVSNLLLSEKRCPSVWLTERLWEAGIAPAWSGHGQARPWQVTERLLFSSAPRSKVRRNGVALVRQMAVGVSYLARLTRFAAIPVSVDVILP